MKTFYSTLFIFGIAMMMHSSAYQYAGGSITYTNLGGYEYQILLTVYMDCAGGTPPTTDTITITSSCGTNFSIPANQISVSNVGDTICHNTLTTCQGGTAAGIQKVQYSVTLALPPGCANWTFSFHDYYRNCAITTMSYPYFCTSTYYGGFYLESKINNLAAQNNSVQYNTDAVIFTCTNQPLCFNVGAVDPDADSLVYSLISPRISALTNINYYPPYTYSAPLAATPALSLNSSTGQICFTPTTDLVTIMTVLVQEYRGGFVIGQTARDIEINVTNCVNHPPTQGLDISYSFYNFSIVGRDTIAACAPNKLDLYIYGYDSDTTDVLTMTWNSGNLPASATFGISGSPRPTGSFDWPTTLVGTYYFSVTVKDNHCPTPDSTTITYYIITSNLQATITNSINSCAASATVHPTGGITNYQYLWSPGSLTTQTISIISSGTYFVTVTDAGSCTTTANITLGVTAYGISTSFTQSSCSSPTGTASVTVSGGTSPFSYYWSNGQSTSTATGLSAGIYTVTVTDANNCARVSSVSVVSLSGASLSLSSTATGCGQPSGTASVIAYNGANPYTYLWNNGQISASVSGLSAGTMTVTVTDANQCKTTGSITVSAPTGLTVTLNKVDDASCSGSHNGDIELNISGHAPYTYLWSNGATTPTATGLSVGTYTVTVTDASACTATLQATVNQPSPILISPTASQAGCSTQSGTITVYPSGGNNPYIYSYRWSNGQLTSTISGLSSGTYRITVTDSRNCSSTASLTLTVLAGPALSVSHANVSCNGGSDGSATVTASGTTPPYTYQWSNGGSQSYIANLSAQTYSVTVTDWYGCSSQLSVTITQPMSGIVLSTSSVSGNCNGSASVSASGGANPYSYRWDDGQSASTALSLTTGTYSVTVTDANGCTAVTSVSITATQGLTAAITGTTSVCSGQPATMTASGGSTYLWNTGQTTDTISTLIIGTYSVTVTNGFGCTGTASVTVALNQLPLNFPRSYTICESGSVMLTASGGTTYAWSPSFGLSCTSCPNPVANPSLTTTYTVTVSSGACSDTALVTVISAPSPIPPVITVGAGDTLFSTHYSTYQWYYNGVPIANATNSFYTALSCGLYSVLITDSNGCSSTSAGINVCTGVNTISNGDGIMVYPNPVTQLLVISHWSLGRGGSIEFYNVLGEKVLSKEFSSDKTTATKGQQTVIDVSALASGVYIIRVNTSLEVSGSEKNKWIGRIIKQ